MSTYTGAYWVSSIMTLRRGVSGLVAVLGHSCKRRLLATVLSCFLHFQSGLVFLIYPEFNAFYTVLILSSIREC